MARCIEIETLSKTLRKEMSEEALFNNTAFKSSSGEYEIALEIFSDDKDNENKGFQTGSLAQEGETDENYYHDIGGERQVDVYQSVDDTSETQTQLKMSSTKQSSSRKPTNTNKNSDSRSASNTSYSEAKISKPLWKDTKSVINSTESGSIQPSQALKTASERARDRGRNTPPNLSKSDVKAQCKADNPNIEALTYEQVKIKNPDVNVENSGAIYENVERFECKKREVQCSHGCPGNRLMFFMVAALLVLAVVTFLLVISMLLGVIGPQCLCNNKQIAKGNTTFSKANVQIVLAFWLVYLIGVGRVGRARVK